MFDKVRMNNKEFCNSWHPKALLNPAFSEAIDFDELNENLTMSNSPY